MYKLKCLYQKNYINFGNSIKKSPTNVLTNFFYLSGYIWTDL